MLQQIDDYVILLWPMHGSAVQSGDRCSLLKNRIAESVMPERMEEIISEYRKIHQLKSEEEEVTSLRFTGVTGNDLLISHDRLRQTRDHYLDPPLPRAVAALPAKAMPRTPVVASPPIPSTTIPAKPMPTTRHDVQQAGGYRQGHGDIRNNPNFGSQDAPASKAARREHELPVNWQSWQSYSWNTSSGKGDGKGKSGAKGTSWESGWNAWQTNQQDRTQAWNWGSGGGR